MDDNVFARNEVFLGRQPDGVKGAQLPVSASERNTWRKPEKQNRFTQSPHNMNTENTVLLRRL